jgi:hypothetical protein
MISQGPSLAPLPPYIAIGQGSSDSPNLPLTSAHILVALAQLFHWHDPYTAHNFGLVPRITSEGRLLNPFTQGRLFPSVLLPRSDSRGEPRGPRYHHREARAWIPCPCQPIWLVARQAMRVLSCPRRRLVNGIWISLLVSRVIQKRALLWMPRFPKTR